MSQQINLFNPDFRKKRELFSAVMLAQAVGAVLALAACVYVYQYLALKKETARLKTEDAALVSERDKLVETSAKYAPHTKSAALEQQAETLEQRLKGEQAVLDVLKGGNFGNTSGYSEYMRAFARQTVPGVWLTGFTINGAGVDISIEGRTLRPEGVPAYIQRLNQEPVMQGRTFAALEMQQPKGEPATADKPAQVHNYLEFRLHSGPLEEKK